MMVANKKLQKHCRTEIRGGVEEGDVALCAAIVTMTEGTLKVHFNNVTDQPYNLKKRHQIANFAVLRPEQMKHVKPVHPVFTW